MKKQKVFITAGVLAIAGLFVLYGCGSGNEEQVQAASDSQATAGEQIPEIYTLLPHTSLSGVQSPYMADRSNIDKALPFEPKDPANIVIGWTEITLGNPWFVASVEAAKAKADEYGYELRIQVADGDVQKQSAQIDSFITQSVDIIVVDPVDLLAPVADIRRAVAAGIPVVAVGTEMDASAPIITTVQNNAYENGFQAGLYIAEQYDVNEQINVATILGIMGSSVSESRINGMITGFIFKRYELMGQEKSREEVMLEGFNLFQKIVSEGGFQAPGVNLAVVAWGVGSWTQEGGLQAAETILAAHADNLDIIFAENDHMGIGSLLALENIGMKGQIQVACAADGLREAIELVQSGELLTTGPCAGDSNGEGVIEFIHRLVNGQIEDPDNLPLSSYFPSDVITRENADQFYDPDKPFYMYEIPRFRTIPEIVASLQES